MFGHLSNYGYIWGINENYPPDISDPAGSPAVHYGGFEPPSNELSGLSTTV
jgi:hypothetical protein